MSTTTPERTSIELHPELDDKKEADARRLRLAEMSGRVETGTLGDCLFQLNDFWQGGDMPQSVYEREEVRNVPESSNPLDLYLTATSLVQIIFHWGHVSPLRLHAVRSSHAQL
jgi:hypothetical protein